MKRVIFGRREFLKGVGSVAISGFTIGTSGVNAGCTKPDNNDTSPEDWKAWLHIDKAGLITLYCPRMEMGQGVLTGLGMLVAEELDADWDCFSVVHAPLDDQFGTQRTENSDAIRSNWLMMRQLGANARARLIEAAASRWSVDEKACVTNAGSVLHTPTGRKFTYGELVSDASRLTVVNQAPLKDPLEYRLIGQNRLRLDIPPMLDGTLKFVADLSLPDMLCATVIHSPKLGGKVESLDAGSAMAIPGVNAVLDLGSFVAIVAESLWVAEKARKTLKVEWAAPAVKVLSSDAMISLLRAACFEPAVVHVDRGEMIAGRSASQDVLAKEYSVPFDGHATMEPTACIADVRRHSCEVWAPTQDPWSTYRTVRDYGLSPLDRFRERVSLKLTRKAGSRAIVHSMPMGGAFGRRLEQDFVREAILVSSAVGRPIKMQWTREEDFANDFFRPASCHRIQASLNSMGYISSWYHRIAGSGILDHGADFPYDCENVRVEISNHDLRVPTGSMRSTAHSPNAFAREVFMDEAARLAVHDPVDYRLAQLSGNARLEQVLQRVAKMSDWYAPGKHGLAKGVAVHPSKGSFVAQVAEISVSESGEILVHRIWCALDCGLVINPDSVKAQIEGAILFGLTSALYASISISDGRIQENNFDSYPLLSISGTPSVEIEIVSSTASPSGIGEIGVPPVAPAVSNAVFALTKRRLRDLPLRLGHS